MTDEHMLLQRTTELATNFLDTLDERPVFPKSSLEEIAGALGGPLPDSPSDPLEVIELMAREIERGVVGTAGPRYFGYVIGGALPATVAADWLTAIWDQCAGFSVLAPSASVVEEIVGDWLKELLGLPPDSSFAITTGTQMAHVTALAAARHDVLSRHDWDVREDGLVGSPPITVVAGRHRHVTIDRALRLLGIGEAQIVPVPSDEQGRMSPSALRDALVVVDSPTIVCAQAGEVNTGAFDTFAEIAEMVRKTDAWLHVDGAFGLWIAASPSRRYLVEGVSAADSWSADAHKWLNVPYDAGLVFCRRPDSHRAAMTARAAYFEGADKWAREAYDWTPESSRRARAFTVYAALRSLGTNGVADLVDRCCDLAARFAEAIALARGCEVLNDVVINQVLFRFGDDETTQAVLTAVQESGEAWVGGTTWDDRPAIRLSVSNWRTSEADIDRTVAAFEAALVAV